jgi:hypothetical protein
VNLQPLRTNLKVLQERQTQLKSNTIALGRQMEFSGRVSLFPHPGGGPREGPAEKIPARLGEFGTIGGRRRAT